ncbi:hypothetical protein BY458DRAFT_495458 [Sporodiniella umbellata]|nr:hypothetical protein BY458DRAFT_495458 [Sporodiniella umbellata]
MSEKFVEEEKNSKMLLSDYNKENQELKKKLEKILDLIKTETEQKQYNESEDSSDSEATDDNDCEPKVSKKEEKYKSPEIIDDSDVNESQEENPETIEVEEKYLHDNEKDLTFDQFIEYNKEDYIFIDSSNTRIKDREKLNLFIIAELGKKDYKDIYITQEPVPDLEMKKIKVKMLSLT